MTRLTTDEAAERIRVTPATVRKMIRSGQLVGSYVGRQWLIEEQAIEDLMDATSTRTRRRRKRAS